MSERHEENGREEQDSLQRHQQELGRQSCRPLTLEEERALFIQRNNGDPGAVGRIWEAHQRLVFKIAGEYQRHGVPRADLLQEGNLALREAIAHFDPEKAYPRNRRLLHYARLWIERAMELAIQVDKSGGRGYTEHLLRQISTYDQAFHRLGQENSCTPSIEEIARDCKWSIKVTRKVHEAWLSYHRPAVSWDDVPIWSASPSDSRDRGLSLSERLVASEDRRSPMPLQSPNPSSLNSPYTAAEKEVLKQQLQTVFVSLIPDYQQVLIWYYGEEWTDTKIGLARGTQREAANKLRNRAIEALRDALQKAGMRQVDLQGIMEYLMGDQ